MAGEYNISEFIQNELLKRGMQHVSAVEAAQWLDSAGFLQDSKAHPGKPLRDLLRAGIIQGQRQESNRRWFIDRLIDARSESRSSAPISAQPQARPMKKQHSADPEVKGLVAEVSNLAQRFDEARERYRPGRIRYLLVAESPPRVASGRFFYFEGVHDADSLFWETMKVLYPADCLQSRPARHRKREFLDRFKTDGFYLLDAVTEPIEKPATQFKRARIRESLPRLCDDLRRCCNSDTKIILISSPVYAECADSLRAEGFNVINETMIDFPGSGCQRKFRDKLAALLRNN
jgi:hypothetical protein